MSYNDIKNELSLMNGSFSVIDSLIQELDTNQEMDDELNNIGASLIAIEQWVQRGEQNELLDSFLTDLRTLFTNYSTTLSIVQGTPSYGENYGQSADKLKFNISKDGVSAEKVFDKEVITLEDIS